MDNFGERFEYNEFDEKEQLMEDIRMESEQKYNESVPLELKEDSFETIESVQEAIPENYVETRELPNLNEVSENIRLENDKKSKKESVEWKEGDGEGFHPFIVAICGRFIASVPSPDRFCRW